MSIEKIEQKELEYIVIDYIGCIRKGKAKGEVITDVTPIGLPIILDIYWDRSKPLMECVREYAVKRMPENANAFAISEYNEHNRRAAGFIPQNYDVAVQFYKIKQDL